MLTALARSAWKEFESSHASPLFACISLPWRGRGDPFPPLIPTFPLLQCSCLNPHVGLGDLRGDNPSPPRGLEAAQHGGKRHCPFRPWPVEVKDSSVKRRCAKGKRHCMMEKTGDTCPGFLFPSPSEMEGHAQPPRTKRGGVAAPFPASVLSPASPPCPAPPRRLPSRVALRSQDGAHCFGCCPHTVVQLMHFFRSSS